MVLSVDAPEVQSAFRAGLGARFTFLSDSERRWIERLGLRETTDTLHDPYQPAGFTLFPDLTIHRVYNGYWYWGRAYDGGASPRHARDHAGDPRGLGGPAEVTAALPFAYVGFDGQRLDPDPAVGRRLRIDASCLDGEPVRGAFASVCALADEGAALRFDEPEVQQARRDALAWWIPLLSDDLVCISTFALDASRYAGAVTVARRPTRFDDDPFARLFPRATVGVDFLCPVPPPSGPVIERYAGAPWPAGAFEAV